MTRLMTSAELEFYKINVLNLIECPKENKYIYFKNCNNGLTVVYHFLNKHGNYRYIIRFT